MNGVFLRIAKAVAPTPLFMQLPCQPLEALCGENFGQLMYIRQEPNERLDRLAHFHYDGPTPGIWIVNDKVYEWVHVYTVLFNHMRYVFSIAARGPRAFRVFVNANGSSVALTEMEDPWL